MTAQFDPTSQDVDPAYHASVAPGAAGALLRSFFKQVPSTDGLDGISRVARLETMVSLLVTAQIEQTALILDLVVGNAQMQAKLDAHISSTTNLLGTHNEAIAQIMETSAEKFEAVAHLITVLGTEVFGPPPSEEASGTAIEPVDLISPDGYGLTLTFPGGDPYIVDEQGFFGFRLLPAAESSVEDVADYLDDVAIALFERDLLSDQMSDVFLDITNTFRAGKMPTPEQVMLISESTHWTDDHEQALRMWFESGVEGWFIVPRVEGGDPQGILAVALWRVFFNSAKKDMVTNVLKNIFAGAFNEAA